jgi:hypothetical protein
MIKTDHLTLILQMTDAYMPGCQSPIKLHAVKDDTKKQLLPAMSMFRGLVKETTLEGQLNIHMPPKIVGQVWLNLSVPDLTIYGGTSSFNYTAIQSAIRDSICRFVGPFVANQGFDNFMTVLSFEKAVISGLVPLFIMFSCSLTGAEADEGKWKPADMDIYEPSSGECGVSGMAKYLIGVERFKEVGGVISPSGEQYNLNRNIKKIVRLRRGKFSIDIITAPSCSPIGTIFNFHLTLVMNWISGDGLFSAYPRLTSLKRGLVNPTVLTLCNYVPPLPPSNVQSVWTNTMPGGSISEGTQNAGLTTTICVPSLSTVHMRHDLSLTMGRCL